MSFDKKTNDRLKNLAGINEASAPQWTKADSNKAVAQMRRFIGELKMWRDELILDDADLLELIDSTLDKAGYVSEVEQERSRSLTEGTWSIPETSQDLLVARGIIDRLVDIARDAYKVLGDDKLLDTLENAIDRAKELTKWGEENVAKKPKVVKNKPSPVWDAVEFWVDVVEVKGIKASLHGDVEFGPNYIAVNDENGKSYRISGSAYRQLINKYNDGRPFQVKYHNQREDEIQFVDWEETQVIDIYADVNESARKVSEAQSVDMYEFSELSGKAQSKAREFIRARLANDQDSTEEVTERFRQELDELYYPTDDIRWSLGHSQGDGMAFYGKLSEDMLKNVAKRLMTNSWWSDVKALDFWGNLYGASITPNSFGSHYAHYNTMTVTVESNIDGSIPEEDQEKLASLYDELEKAMQEDVKDVSRVLERAGYEILDQQTSDEAVQEYLDNNEILFEEDGDIFSIDGRRVKR